MNLCDKISQEEIDELFFAQMKKISINPRQKSRSFSRGT